MFLLLLAHPSFALDIPAPTADQRVYKVPARWTFPLGAATEAAGHTERKVWVVAYEKVIDGSIPQGRASETEDAIEQVWAVWSAEGEGVFSPQQDALVLLGMDDREVRVRMGSEWDARLGLHNDRLLPLIDANFLPRAAASDYDGGLAALVTAVDKAVADGLHQLEVARQREEAAAAESARRLAEQAAKAEADRREAEAQAAQLRAAAPWAGGGIGALVAAVGLGARRRRAKAAEDAFRAAVAERRARLDAADTTFASFRVDTELRDRIVELRLKGPVTTAAFREVSGTLDRVQVGLGALRQRLDTIEAGAKAGALAVAPWEAATAALDAPFAVETGRIQHRLFESPNETVEIEPLPFMEALEADYARARAGWERLLDAVEATLRRATDDLPLAPLEAHHARLDLGGLPRAWAAVHPLAADAEGAWAALEAARHADPVAYLDALDAAIAAAEAAEETVSAVLEDKAEAEATRARALEAPEVPDTVVDVPARDPALLLTEARARHAELKAALAEGKDVEESGRRADAAIAAWSGLAECREALARTVATVAGDLAAAEARLGALKERLRAGRAAGEALAGEHAAGAMGGVWREVGQAAADLTEAEAALVVAREALAGRRHVAAEIAVHEATDEHGQALQNLEELNAAMAKLTALKADVLAQLATIDAERSRAVGTLRGYGVYGDLSVLAAGDRLLSELRAERSAGPVDWSERRARLHAVLAAWSAGVSAAERAWRAEQERLRRIREEEERQRRLAREAEERRRRAAAAAVAAAASRRSASAYRSSSSSFGSGRSGGSSFGGGGGRSGGSSFGGGGGRSGGRKF